MKKKERVEVFESQMAYFKQTDCVQQFINVFSSEENAQKMS